MSRKILTDNMKIDSDLHEVTSEFKIAAAAAAAAERSIRCWQITDSSPYRKS